jgi:hypothetical protein
VKPWHFIFLRNDRSSSSRKDSELNFYRLLSHHPSQIIFTSIKFPTGLIFSPCNFFLMSSLKRQKHQILTSVERIYSCKEKIPSYSIFFYRLAKSEGFFCFLWDFCSHHSPTRCERMFAAEVDTNNLMWKMLINVYQVHPWGQAFMSSSHNITTSSN